MTNERLENLGVKAFHGVDIQQSVDNHSHGNITERCVLNLLYMTIAWHCKFLMQQYTFPKKYLFIWLEGVNSCKRLAKRLA